jgi:hypothetical protein
VTDSENGVAGESDLEMQAQQPGKTDEKSTSEMKVSLRCSN